MGYDPSTYVGAKLTYDFAVLVDNIYKFIKEKSKGKPLYINECGVKAWVRKQMGVKNLSQADWKMAWDEISRKPGISKCTRKGSGEVGYKYSAEGIPPGEECGKEETPDPRILLKRVVDYIAVEVKRNHLHKADAKSVRPAALEYAGLALKQKPVFWGPISKALKKIYGIVLDEGFYVYLSTAQTTEKPLKRRRGRPSKKLAPVTEQGNLMPKSKTSTGSEDALHEKPDYATSLQIVPPGHSVIEIVLGDGSIITFGTDTDPKKRIISIIIKPLIVILMFAILGATLL